MKKKKLKKLPLKKIKGNGGNGSDLFDFNGRQRTSLGVRKLLAAVALKIAEEKSPDEICEDLNIDFKTFTQYRDKLFDQMKAEVTNKTELEVYLDYCLRSQKLIRDLESLKENFKNSNQYNALVGAIRAQSDIYDRMINRGQELGIIAKSPESLHIIGGVDVRTLNDHDVRVLIKEELDRGQELLSHIEQRQERAAVRKAKRVEVLDAKRQPKALSEGKVG